MSDSGEESNEMEEEVRQGFARVDNIIRALDWSNDEHDVDDEDNLNAVLEQIRTHNAWPWARTTDAEDSPDQDAEEFDIHLPTAHAYLASEVADENEDAPMSEVRGTPVFEEGWNGELMCFPHPMVVLPGEVVPLLIRDPAEVMLFRAALERDRAFCLLSEERLGVVCRVLEEGGRAALGVRARAVARVRAGPTGAAGPSGPGPRRVSVLPDSTAVCRPHVGAPWPHWLYSCSEDNEHIAFLGLPGDSSLRLLKSHRYPSRAVAELRACVAAPLPEDVSALSWAAGGRLPPATRARLLRCSGAWARAVEAWRGWRGRGAGWACAHCGRGVAQADDERPMSSDGVGAAYTNPGGVMHDVVTVCRVRGALTSGGSHATCSWFPGYRWSVLLCVGCRSHLGWRYDAIRKRLRPQRFYGLTRSNLSMAADCDAL